MKGIEMLHLNHRDLFFISHATDVMAEQIAIHDGYEDEDIAANDKMKIFGNDSIPRIGSALVVTGDDIDAQTAEELMSQVIEAEMNNWVPGSSPRLIWRVGTVLGFRVPEFILAQGNPDCGPRRIDHPLYPLWMAKRYLMSCSTCGRLFPS